MHPRGNWLVFGTLRMGNDSQFGVWVGANMYGTVIFIPKSWAHNQKNSSLKPESIFHKALTLTQILKLHTPSSAKLYKATAPFKHRTFSSFFSNFADDLSHTKLQPTPGTIPDQFLKSIPTSPMAHQLVNVTTCLALAQWQQLVQQQDWLDNIWFDDMTGFGPSGNLMQPTGFSIENDGVCTWEGISSCSTL